LTPAIAVEDQRYNVGGFDGIRRDITASVEAIGRAGCGKGVRR